MPASVNFAGPFVPVQGSDLKAEDLTSQIDGSKVQFTVSEQFQGERLFVFLNGLFQGPSGGTEITVNNATQFTIATTPLTGDNLAVIYSPTIKTSSTC
jgi:hypothetical protein|tara:strand:+ start:504 stop:797 length:294 start_codon:yes stop_codon:yes gene_type:complete